MTGLFRRIIGFYVTGFREMTWGRSLWVIILVKLFVMFVILKIFFFPNFLKSNFETDEARKDYVIEAITKPKS
ncbi:MAG TPA: DUF4492 domain-containing protein [Bacteroidales bacterium]|nr:DUF4492 domain-containing protein [Bacteroidales bacterium]HRZ49900.1 DUF4492 domain-containing protein [Bacteroidales bacterium]